MGTIMIKLIVGLGNVGVEYKDTRHNAGFWFVDALSDKFGIMLTYDFTAVLGVAR